MIPELGHYALIVALSLSISQAVLPWWGIVRSQERYLRLAQYTAIAQLLFVGLSFLLLVYAFVSNDFSVAYVANNSNTRLPLIYRLCAIWGAHEGSLLLWVLILCLWSVAVSRWSRPLPLDMLARVLSILAFIGIGFYLFLLTTSNPFARWLPNYPVDGADLNPLLQDPGLVLHPPILYMGYVGFSVVFACAIAALAAGRLNAEWARWSRPWTTLAWCFLTLGIVLGSWWAYRELGWGGWWFWDPVENASFLPWLAGTALLHSLIVTEKRDVFKAWTVLLAITAFSLSLLGTFLVRSGVLISVHAFAVDSARGAFVLRFLTITIGSSLLLYAWRAKHIVNTGTFDFWSRETMLLVNNLLLLVAMMTVLLGTLYPLIIDAWHLDKVSVGAPYFNTVFIPLMWPLLFLMGWGPLFYWHHRDPKVLLRQSIILLFMSILLALVFSGLWGERFLWSVLVGVTLSLWILFNTIRAGLTGTAPYSMMLAHGGVAVMVMGIVLTTAYSQHRDFQWQVGERAQVGPYQFQLLNVLPIVGPNYTGLRGVVKVSKENHAVTVLYPEQRLFTVTKTTLAKTDIHASLFHDLYVALGTSMGPNTWGVRIYYKPFVRWIWMGGLLMVLGGLVSMVTRYVRQQTTI
ncbi:MAG: c-type cytochrome biogenesis protein CcmF [Coxiella sp. RIFCSPHIGHO2_12_FULL_44_14]|nr:MAG: c-type cytochrome biogenesis protein CcmF [Coxiella sp. RIFCSPHIGHO2_12_FULL_44_14]